MEIRENQPWTDSVRTIAEIGAAVERLPRPEEESLLEDITHKLGPCAIPTNVARIFIPFAAADG